MGLTVEAAEHDGGGFDGVTSGLQTREFFGNLWGGGLSVEGRSPAVRCNLVVDLVGGRETLFRFHCDHTVVGTVHPIPFGLNLELADRDVDLFFTFLTGVATVESLVVNGVGSRGNCKFLGARSY